MSEPTKALNGDDLPALYRALSTRSAEAQRNVLRAVKASLGGAVLAAVLGLFQVKVNGFDLAALVASLGFLVSLLATSWLLWRRPERDWYDARAGAESIKTLAWQYAVAGGEFARSSGAEEEVRGQFLARLREILTGLGSVGSSAAASDGQLTAAMVDLRAASLARRQEAYQAGRIDDQRNWYAIKAAWNERRRKMWAAAAVMVQAVGLAAGLGRAFFAMEVDLLGVAAAFAAGITAWARTKDYAELTEAYTVTAQEIGLLAGQPMPNEEEGWARFVEGAERAFSREHTLWRARKGHRPVG